MVYFTVKLDEENMYSYAVDKISSNIKEFDTNDLVFCSTVDILEDSSIDFWELSDFDVYSGYVYKILDSHNNIATVIDYDDIYDVNDYLYTNGIIIVRIEQLFCSKKEIVDIFERTSEILCDICEIDIPTY